MARLILNFGLGEGIPFVAQLCGIFRSTIRGKTSQMSAPTDQRLINSSFVHRRLEPESGDSSAPIFD